MVTDTLRLEPAKNLGPSEVKRAGARAVRRQFPRPHSRAESARRETELARGSVDADQVSVRAHLAHSGSKTDRQLQTPATKLSLHGGLS